MKTKSYKDLIVWQKSIQLVLQVYRLSSKFPREEVYGLTSQIRRSAVAIPSNIAEGYARRSRQEYLHFLSIAFASAAELETQLIIARKLNLSNMNSYNKSFSLLEEVSKLLNTIMKRLRSSGNLLNAKR